MPRPLWSGSISFGLVHIPVKLYNAVKKQTLSFHQLRKKDGCRIRFKRVCSTDGEEVPLNEIVKAYELSPERYVVLSAEDIAKIKPIDEKTINIEDFVELNQIDPLYFDHSYYLVPDKAAGKAYSLLFQALAKTHKVALAKFVMREKEHLAVLRVAGNTISMATMFYHDEVVPASELDIQFIEPNEKELSVAIKLIESLSADFKPENYKDEYREKLLAVIEKKAEGQQIITEPVPRESNKVIDLMAALEASLASINKQPAKKVKPAKRKTTKTAKTGA